MHVNDGYTGVEQTANADAFAACQQQNPTNRRESSAKTKLCLSSRDTEDAAKT